MVRIATGAIASQAIVIGATPLLTRLYEPEDFGALAVFTALYAIVAGVFTLKYELSIILPRISTVHTASAARSNLRLEILTCMLPAL